MAPQDHVDYTPAPRSVVYPGQRVGKVWRSRWEVNGYSSRSTPLVNMLNWQRACNQWGKQDYRYYDKTETAVRRNLTGGRSLVRRAGGEEQLQQIMREVEDSCGGTVSFKVQRHAEKDPSSTKAYSGLWITANSGASKADVVRARALLASRLDGEVACKPRPASAACSAPSGGTKTSAPVREWLTKVGNLTGAEVCKPGGRKLPMKRHEVENTISFTKTLIQGADGPRPGTAAPRVRRRYLN